MSDFTEVTTDAGERVLKHAKVGYLSGSFDMFRIDHLDQLEAASRRCEVLVVGVHTDELVLKLTGKAPVMPFGERLEIVRWMQQVGVAVAQSSEFLCDMWDVVRFDLAFVPRALDAAQTDYEQLEQLGVEIVPLPTGRSTASILRQQS